MGKAKNKCKNSLYSIPGCVELISYHNAFDLLETKINNNNKTYFWIETIALS